MADFTAKWTEMAFDTPEEGTSLPRKEHPDTWTIDFEDSYTKGQGGAGVVLTSPTDERLKYVVQMHYQGNISNNTTEYEGLLAGLRAAIGLSIGKVIVKGHSQLVIKQVKKEYASPQMAPYVEEV